MPRGKHMINGTEYVYETVSSSESLEGKLFIQFVALIHLLYIKKAMTEHSLFPKYTIQELLDELDVIE